MKKLIYFLNTLEQNHIFYRISKSRDDSIMIEVAIPGERWEIEFMGNGSIQIEKFLSNGEIVSEEELKILFQNFSD